MNGKWKCLILFGLIGPFSNLWSQPYGNEWIDFNKSYYKISVSNDGIYQLNFETLTEAGVPLSSLDPRTISIYHRGVEQAIFVQGEGDGSFDPGDFIQFYGQRNDGTQDRFLYQPQTAQPHNYFNLYSDTTAYFLTWDTGGNQGLRVASVGGPNPSLPLATHHNAEQLLLTINRYARGFQFSSAIFNTFFDQAEGYTSHPITLTVARTFTLSGLTNGNQSIGKPRIEVFLFGENNQPHRAQIEVGAAAGSLRVAGIQTFSGYTTAVFNQEIEWSDISAAGNLTVRIIGLDAGTPERFSCGYIKVTFPQNPVSNPPGKKINLPVNPGGQTYFEIPGASPAILAWDITNKNTPRRVLVQSIGGGAGLLIPGTNIARTLILDPVPQLPGKIESVTFRNINPAQAGYVIISHPTLRNPAGAYSDPVKAYGGYRASADGGGHDTLTIDIGAVYDLFNYGEYSSLAIKNMMRFLVENGSPEFLFLIGKAIEPSFSFANLSYRLSPEAYTYKDLVPTAGSPGSDMAFTTGIGGAVYEPAVPTGRLTASSPAEVAGYLDKVIIAESTPFDALWRKRILHLSGGISTSEIIRFNGYMNGFKALAEGIALGGEVKTITKSASVTTELINIAEEVNNGLNLVTFYGHSAPNIPDIEIGFVSDPVLGYNNPDRFPSFLILGCNAGQFFNNARIFGEDWTLTAGKGALGFIAHSALGFENTLRRYGDFFYETAYGDPDFFGMSIGEIQKETARRYMNASSPNPSNTTQVIQMVLLGDPAVKLFGANLPDYEINSDNIFLESIDGEPVTAETTDFNLGMVVRNFGKALTDSVLIRVQRTLPDNSIVTTDSLFLPIYFSDTLFIPLTNANLEVVGTNRFEVIVDADNQIEELNEMNNSAFIDQLLNVTGTRNIFPHPYALVPSSEVKLVAQAADIFGNEREFLFELDTVPDFNSPFRQTFSMIGTVLGTWQPFLGALPDTIAVFWRTRFAQPLPGESDSWSMTSFTYIIDSDEGWGQVRKTQMAQNNLNGLELNDTQDRLEFFGTEKDLYVRTFGNTHPEFTRDDAEFVLDDVPYMFSSRICRNNTINLVAINRFSLTPYPAVPLIFQDPKTCGRQPQVINSFALNEAVNLGFLQQYMDGVEDGDLVVAFSLGNAQFHLWPQTSIDLFQSIGVDVTELQGLGVGHPLIILGRKGSSIGSATVIRTTNIPENQQEISFSETLSGFFSSGSITSQTIGPALSWGRFLNKVSLSQSPAFDTYDFELKGISFTGNETTLFSNITNEEFDLSGVDPLQYPFLRIVYRVGDEVNLSAAQLDYWLVEYETPPEGILMRGNFPVQGVEIQEGAPFQANMGFYNISEKSFPDSLQVDLETFNNISRKSFKTSFNIAAPAPGDTTNFPVNVDTRGKAGLNNFNLFVNPRITAEQVYNNNQINRIGFLEVDQDETNPYIDVAFDGRYIMDGEIVSPEPLITIQLRDENPFLFKKDTTGIDVFLLPPCEGCNFKRISFSDPRVNWTPGDEDNNFKIEYQSPSLENGIYTLRIQASDETGNTAGEEPFQVRFEVINESTITNFYPYPNPFSTSTRFVFTLTGSEIPDQIKIQIMTVTGKIVREITQDELGSIRIGNNLTDFAWNGRDEYGDQLANGVYLYRVIVRVNGETLEHRDTSADKAFKHGIGKMYLLR